LFLCHVTNFKFRFLCLVVYIFVVVSCLQSFWTSPPSCLFILSLCDRSAATVGGKVCSAVVWRAARVCKSNAHRHQRRRVSHGMTSDRRKRSCVNNNVTNRGDSNCCLFCLCFRLQNKSKNGTPLLFVCLCLYRLLFTDVCLQVFSIMFLFFLLCWIFVFYFHLFNQ